MIVYDLTCCNGHTFEGWFKDGKEFKKQQRTGLIACPVCENTKIVRIPSTFAIKGASGSQPSLPKHDKVELDPGITLRTMRRFLEKHFDDVGTDFAKEALKIHYGVSEPRNIRGVSTTSEEETLRQEGIDFVKIPLPPDEPPVSSDS